MPRTGSALWHSHPRNRIPHVHIEAAKLNDEKARQLRRHIGGHEHHHHAGSGRSDNETGPRRGRANMTIRTAPAIGTSSYKAHLPGVAHQLLELAVSEIWFAIHDPFRQHHSIPSRMFCASSASLSFAFLDIVGI
jgi:hypothetical protein